MSSRAQLRHLASPNFQNQGANHNQSMPDEVICHQLSSRRCPVDSDPRRSPKESTRSEHLVCRTSPKHWVAKNIHHNTCIGIVYHPALVLPSRNDWRTYVNLLSQHSRGFETGLCARDAGRFGVKWLEQLLTVKRRPHGLPARPPIHSSTPTRPSAIRPSTGAKGRFFALPRKHRDGSRPRTRRSEYQSGNP